MKTIYTNIKKGEAKVKIEKPDDFWYLTTIIDKGDLVSGKTIRKIKIGEKDQRSMKIIKKPVYIAIKVEKVEFSKTSGILRVAGITFEIHRVVGKFNDGEDGEYRVTHVLPVCGVGGCNKKSCGHEYIKHIGIGQQGITKLLKR